MKRSYLLALSATLLTLAGCATILGGSSQLLTVNSNISGADVFLNDTPLGKTPLSTSIKRGQEGVLRVTAPGYQPYQIALNKKISTLFWVNLLSGGAFGSTTDYMSGAMYEYEPSTYMVSLQRTTASASELEQWRKKEGLRGFVLLNSAAIVTDLAKGSGEYVDVLARALSIPSQDRAAAVRRWQADYTNSKTAAEFAAKLVSEMS